MPAIRSRAGARTTTLDLMQYIAASPTAAHAIAVAVQRLEQAGFNRLAEEDAWRLRPNARFYVVRGHTALVAGRIGASAAAETGFRIAGAHCDAPGLRLKPKPVYAGHGYLQLGVEIYGGPLLASWVDRDLTLAGRLLVRTPNAPPRVVLVRAPRPLCRIPQVAIHLNRKVNEEGLKLDAQRHLPPILGLGDERALRNEPLVEFFAAQAGVKPAAVTGYDLEVVDTQPPALGGLHEEFLLAPRLDNLAGSHAALEALLRLESPRATCVAALFDSEEIGSQTANGAASRFLDAVLERICLAQSPAREDWHRACARSLLVSIDAAHAVHPNYADLHDPHHRPRLNGGPVIKVNAAQRYATSAQTRHWFEHCAQRATVPVQHYVHRSDLPCGSTIGPIAATRLGIPTVDVGSPILAMHSIRETGGAMDQEHMIQALVVHFAEEVAPKKSLPKPLAKRPARPRSTTAARMAARAKARPPKR